MHSKSTLVVEPLPTPEITASKVKPIEENSETEIVVVSNTVRQRRIRIPSVNDSQTINSQQDQQQLQQQKQDEQPSTPPSEIVPLKTLTTDQVLPDLLPPQTFRLAESSSLFSQISKNRKEDNEPLKDQSAVVSVTNIDNTNQPQSVAIVERNLKNHKMSVQNIDIAMEHQEPHVGEIVDTVNILESVDPFVPEFVETVQIVDLSEDSDSSMRLEDDEELNASMEKIRNNIKINIADEDADDEVEMRVSPNNTSTPILRVEKQRISFDEKRKRIETERDILRDSEEEVDPANEISKPKLKRWRQQTTTTTTPSTNSSIITSTTTTRKEIDANLIRNSFYSADKEPNLDLEPLVFSDDEDIPRLTFETAPGIDFDSETVTMIMHEI